MRDLNPTPTHELNKLFEEYRNIIKYRPLPDENVEGAFNRLETPTDWHELEFQTLPGDKTIPLWVSLLASLGLWAVAYYLVVWFLVAIGTIS